MPGLVIQDIPLFEDLLRTAGDAEKCHFMINSPGGNADTADKIITMCRRRFRKEFNVIVPDFAKSAATMIALGSDKILIHFSRLFTTNKIVVPRHHFVLIYSYAYIPIYPCRKNVGKIFPTHKKPSPTYHNP